MSSYLNFECVMENISLTFSTFSVLFCTIGLVAAERNAADEVDEVASAVPDGHCAFRWTAAGAEGAGADAGPDVLLLPRRGQRATFQVQPQWILSSTAVLLET